MAHGAAFFTLPLTLLDGRALVVILFALGQADRQLGAAFVPVQIQRDYRIARALDLADQLRNLARLQQQLAGAGGVWMDVGRSRAQRSEVGPQQPCFVVFESDISFGDLRAAITQALDLPSLQGNARLVGVFDEVVVARTSIDRNQAFKRLVVLGFGFAHAQIIGWAGYTPRMNIRESSYGYWTTHASFMWVASGAVIGIGNISRLPYLMGQHGGILFLMVYLAALLLVGLPLLLTEWMLGRWTRDDVVSAYARLSQAGHAHRVWKLVGWFSLAGSALILSYYSVIAGWSAAYIFRAASGVINGIDAGAAREVFAGLAQDPERGLSWHTIFIVMACIVVAHGIRDGMERAGRVWVPIAFLIAITICAYALINGDALAALTYLLAPDFSKLGWRGVLEALHMAFFTLALGIGVMFTLGTYLPANAPLARIGITVVLMDTAFSLIAGLAVFSIIFDAGLDPAPGLALIFQVFPQALPATLWGGSIAVLFFSMMFIITLSSATTMLETATRFVMERYRSTRAFAATAAALLIWFVGLGTLLSFSALQDLRLFNRNFFESAQWLSTSWLAPLSGLLLCIFVARFIPPEVAGGLWGPRNQLGFRLWAWALRFPARIGLIAVLAYSTGFLDWLASLWTP